MLRALPGVGPKVANCVLLFALEHLDAFPIDVWIERVLRERYFRGKRGVTARRLREFSQSHFGPYGGYAQQYLFHQARTSRRGETFGPLGGLRRELTSNRAPKPASQGQFRVSSRTFCSSVRRP